LALHLTVISPEIYTYGAMVIAGALERQGFNIDLVKVSNENDYSKIEPSDIYCIGLYSSIHILRYGNFVKTLKKKFGSPVIVGGPSTIEPKIVFKHLPDVDVVVVGEGEETIKEVVDKFHIGQFSPSNLSGVDGIAYRDGEEIVKTKNRKQTDLSERPPLKVPPDISDQNVRGANIYIESMRGCKGICTFCQVPQLFGWEIRSRPLERIVEEAKMLVERGVKKIAVSGGTTTYYGFRQKIDEDSFTTLLRMLSEVVGSRNLSIPDIRVDAVTEKILKAIRNYTVGWVFYGIESGSQQILNRMHKNIDLDQIRSAVYEAKRSGVKVAGSFITAYPGEGEEDHKQTVELICELQLLDHFVSIAEPIPGTPLYYEAAKLPLEQNQLFIKSEGKLGKRYGLTVAEDRALDLMVTGYASRPYPISSEGKIFENFLAEAKKQGAEIKEITLMAKETSDLRG